MQEDKLVSVIIANYNNQRYLQECLNSILDQTYDNIEIIVVDDCSTDDSLSVLREYEEMHPNIKVFVNDENLGVTKTRTHAISKATADYITTLDADDYFMSNTKIEKEMGLISKFKNECNKDIIAFSNYNKVDIDGGFKFSYAKEFEVETGYIDDLYLLRKKFRPRDFIMSKQQYDSIGGYDEQIPIYEDYEITIRLAAKYEFHYTGSDGTAYRETKEGLSSSENSHHDKWLLYIMKNDFHLLEKKKFIIATKLLLEFVRRKLRFLKRFAERLLSTK